MEPISKSKSSSPSLFRRMNIKDVTNGMDEQDSLTPEPSGYIVITEVPSDSESHSKPEAECSVIIEDIEEPEILNLESAESSDNISQYLDKEEAVVEDTSTENKQSEANTNNEHQQRAKSEEPKQQKRKLSIDSSYSRKSLSKLAFLKKIKQAKDKIKVPKLKLSKTSELSKKPEEMFKSVKAHKSYDPNAKPVYIHIPLKPPEGQVDKYSYLEFEDGKPEKIIPEESTENEIAETAKLTKNLNESNNNEENDHNDFVAFEIVKAESIDFEDATKNGLQGGNDYLIIQQDDDAKSENIIIMMPSTEQSSPTISRTSSKKSLHSRQGSKRIRAKSAEPERKRKLSIESIDSRRSLSKLGILKKIKNAKDKIKFPKLTLSRSNSKKEEKKPEPVISQEPKKETKKSETKNIVPQYIHIPLKPPEGESDEFSYLEFEEKKEKVTASEDPIKDDQSSVESPLSVQNDGVQFIFLTPPSDDEILDQPDIPETPSSEGKVFFSSRVHELKKIAQDAVDEASPNTKQKLLQAVEEEEGSDSSKSPSGTESKNVTFETISKDQSESMVVDEEDGLKLTESAMAKQEQNVKSKKMLETDSLKSGLKSDSPVLKKKVSFKRRSRDESKDSDYEDIQPPSEEIEVKQNPKVELLGTSQSMSVDEEKSYLDDKKIIKDTSLEEDYNRWSKLRYVTKKILNIRAFNKSKSRLK